ncbi:MAG TPA: DUF4058 family protein [Planctomycetaceae bacterium]|nr:DUF4058 family protein [Planctomycetaceae bacterium]
MPSPFPGMNPYLEQDRVCHDFHETFLPAIREALVAQVRPKYLVKIEEVATAAPLYGRVPTAVDIEQLSYVELHDRDSLELVTVLELLSPSNKKHGPDREQYLSKRRQLLARTAHLVELDLLRGGPRLPLEDLPDCDYYAMVSRFDERPQVGLWPLKVREPLPVIPIPLRAPDPDARLDLKPILDRVYDAAGYEDYIYSGAPQPPLYPQDAEWAKPFIPAAPA